MWQVHNEFGPVADFDTQAEAEALAARENEDDPGSHWVLFVHTYGGGGFPKG